MDKTPKRRLDLEGAYNVRDLGGYGTADGRKTRWRTFLRSDNMDRLTPASQAALLDYGIRSVVDLRQTRELEETPNVFSSSSDVAYHHVNVVGDNPPENAVASGLPSDRIRASYTRWIDHRQPQLREVLTTLAAPAARPAIYHCAGGKDRTGVVSAMLLGIAGVPAETIAEDYGLTASYLWERYQAEPRFRLEADVPIESWRQYQQEFCPPEGMIKVLGHLDRSYGGVEGYARAIGLTAEQIQALHDALVE